MVRFPAYALLAVEIEPENVAGGGVGSFANILGAP
jgi:hypothetical protein